MMEETLNSTRNINAASIEKLQKARNRYLKDLYKLRRKYIRVFMSIAAEAAETSKENDND